MSRPGRRGRDELELAQLCRAYLEAVATDPVRPMVLLSKQTGLDPSQLRGLQNRARTKNVGLLTKTVGTRPGGPLTPKALKLLTGPEGSLEPQTPGPWDHLNDEERSELYRKAAQRDLQSTEARQELVAKRQSGEITEEQLEAGTNDLIKRFF